MLKVLVSAVENQCHDKVSVSLRKGERARRSLPGVHCNTYCMASSCNDCRMLVDLHSPLSAPGFLPQIDVTSLFPQSNAVN